MSQLVSTNWYPTLESGNYRVAVKFEVYTAGTGTLLYMSPTYLDPGQSPPTISGTADYPYPAVTGGSVTMEKGQDQRSKFTMELLDPTGFLINDGTLSPWGNEIRIYRGISYGAEGPFEMPLLGTFRITDVESHDTGDGVHITVSGSDRSRIVSRVKVVQFYQTASNQGYSDAIRAMIVSAYPGVIFNDGATAWSHTPPSGIGLENGTNPQMIFTPTVYGITFQEGDDLWTEARNMAASLACDLYFDRSGICTLQADPNLNYMNATLPTIPSPAFEFVEGETCTMTDLDQKFSDSNAYNQWVVYGEGQVLGYTQAPLRSSPARDTDPTSPTYINGPYGVVTGFETNPLMVTVGQINTYANYKLATSTNKLQTIQFTAFVDTALDLDDPILVTRQRVGVTNQLFIIDMLTWPLTVGDMMTVRTRERRAYVYGT